MKVKLKLISGSLKGRSIISEIDGLRPTLSRARTVLFDTLQFNLPENFTFLDCFAGSGIIGIEALSRGASFATFVEIDKDTSLNLIDNIKRLGIENCKVFCSSIFKIKEGKGVDLIYLDPPYKNDFIIPKVVKMLIRRNWVKEGTIIITETHKRSKIKLAFPLWNEKLISNTILSFYKVSELVQD
jgi:16S rRNA (guanine966-N2)-methyltransferase